MKSHVKKVIDKGSKFSNETLITLLTDTNDRLAEVKATLNSLDYGVIVVNEEGRHIVSNKLALTLFQIKELRIDREIWHSIKQTEIKNYLEVTIKSQILGDSKDLWVHNRLVCCQIKPWVLAGSITGSLIWIEDITEKRKQLIRLRQAEAMARLSTMAATLAHEIKNPLGAISIHLQLLKKAIPSSLWTDQIDDTFIIINEEMQRLGAVVHNYLDAARPLSMNMNRCDLLPILRESLDVLLVEASEKKVSMQLIEPRTSIPYLLLDKSLLKNAFINLLQNAMQSEAKMIHIFLDLTLEAVIVKIEDDGIGISSDNLSKIFEPYFTTKKNGNGLGLTIVFKILREHGAHISVESPTTSVDGVERGTRFCLSFSRIDSERMRLTAM